ncbi:MAG TPA: hypothetical protein VHC22_10570 [Pirellulales bacterium]|nr:hypothetical protein [Pirellulales bacterium]
MQGMRFSLRWLFGVVSFLAVGCGLVIYASPLLSKLTFTAAVTALLLAIVLAVYRSGEQRALWAGFAALGLAYLWLICGNWQSPNGTYSLREEMVTTSLLYECNYAISIRVVGPSLQPPLSAYATPAAEAGPPPSASFDPYADPVLTPAPQQAGEYPTSFADHERRLARLTTGHALFAILFGLLGGVVAQRCSSCAAARTTGTHQARTTHQA